MADMAKIAAQNPLSASDAHDSYTGLGCFPIGEDVSHGQVCELVKALHHLREANMLRPLSSARLKEVRADLQPLHEARAFWSNARDSHQAQAIHEFLAAMFPQSPPAEPHHIKIYIYPDSALLDSAGTSIWGAYEYELDAFARNTILYISGRQDDTAGTILHTFLSSRRCARLQCFLAEYVLADAAGRLTADWDLPHRLQEDVQMLSSDSLRKLLSRLERESTLGAPVLLAKLTSLCESKLGAE